LAIDAEAKAGGIEHWNEGITAQAPLPGGGRGLKPGLHLGRNPKRIGAAAVGQACFHQGFQVSRPVGWAGKDAQGHGPLQAPGLGIRQISPAGRPLGQIRGRSQHEVEEISHGWDGSWELAWAKGPAGTKGMAGLNGQPLPWTTPDRSPEILRNISQL
jgi:hypothetical protein